MTPTNYELANKKRPNEILDQLEKLKKDKGADLLNETDYKDGALLEYKLDIKSLITKYGDQVQQFHQILLILDKKKDVKYWANYNLFDNDKNKNIGQFTIKL